MPEPLWFIFPPYRLDAANGQLYEGERPIALRPKTLAVLLHLVERSGEVVSHAELHDAVWPGVVVQDATVAMSVGEIRRALNDSRKDARFVETLHGRGFRFAAEVEVARSGEPRANREGVAVTAMQRPFVGRRDALAALETDYQAAAEGGARIAIVHGPAGIGKTRLLSEVGTRLEQLGARVLRARGDDSLQQSAYWIWVQLLRDLCQSVTTAELRNALGVGACDLAVVIPSIAERLSGIGEPPVADPEVRRARFFDAMASLLRNLAGSRPLVLCFDDLHSASSSSLALLDAMLDLIGHERVLVILSVRDGERQGGPFTELLKRWERLDNAHRLELAGLSEDEGRALLETAGIPVETLARIVRDTEGNPYFILEILASLRQRSTQQAGGAPDYVVPATVRRMLSERLTSLDADTRRLLANAAVAGTDFATPVAIEAAGLDAARGLEAVSEAARLGIVQPSSRGVGALSFAHALMRESLLGELSEIERAACHLRVGRALEQGDATSEDAIARLAYHFGQGASAGDADKAVRYALAAGKHALATHSYDEACDHLRRGLGLIDQGAPVAREVLAEHLCALAESHLCTSDFDASLPIAERLEQLAKQMRSPRWAAQSALLIARHFIPFTPRLERRAIEALEHAVGGLTEEASGLRSLVAAHLAAALLAVSDGEERRVELAREALDAARRLPDQRQRLAIYHPVLMGLWDVDHLDERERIADEFYEASAAAGDPFSIMQAQGWRCIHSLSRGRLRDSENEIPFLEELLPELPTLRAQRYLARIQIVTDVLHGELDKAEAKIPAYMQLSAKAHSPSGPMESFFAQASVLRERGNLSGMLPLIRAGLDRFPNVAWGWLILYVYCETGEIEQARREYGELVRDGLADAPIRNEVFGWLTFNLGMGEVCATLGSAEHAEVMYERLRPYAGHWAVLQAVIVVAGSVDRILGRLAATMGDLERAESHFLPLIAFCEREGQVSELARALVDYAVALERLSPQRAAEAAGIKQRALDLAARHGIGSVNRRLAQATA